MADVSRASALNSPSENSVLFSPKSVEGFYQSCNSFEAIGWMQPCCSAAMLGAIAQPQVTSKHRLLARMIAK